MEFTMTSDTYQIRNARVSELTGELISTLEHRINEKYAHVDISIGTVFRCLPARVKRKTFTRFLKKERDLTIDITVTTEEYEKMYRVEQRYHLGKLFLEVLGHAIDKHKFEGLDKEEFINDIKLFANQPPEKIKIDAPKPGKWFQDEIDWSVDLDR